MAWGLITLLAGAIFGLFWEMRGDRKELRAGLEAVRVELRSGLDSLRVELSSKIGTLQADVSELKVTTARLDERLKGLEIGGH